MKNMLIAFLLSMALMLLIIGFICNLYQLFSPAQILTLVALVVTQIGKRR